MVKTLDNFTNLFSKIISKSWGELASLETPYPLIQKIIREYANIYKVNLDEIEKPMGAYKSLNEFFTRKLKPGARPILGDYVHPCDGVLLSKQVIGGESNIIVKGRAYSVREFLNDSPDLDFSANSLAMVYYLSPKDYHRFHAPFSLDIEWLVHVPGGLYPVNNFGFRKVKDLYLKNERIILGVKCGDKKAIISFVGATNVGSIILPWDRDLKTNLILKNKPTFKKYKSTIRMSPGDELGYFAMGSSIVLILDPSFEVKSLPGPVKMGEVL